VLAPVVRFRFPGLLMQEADQALVTDLLFAQRQPVDHLPLRPAIFLGPLAADDTMVGRGHILPFRV
jgi:hypothetical protein